MTADREAVLRAFHAAKPGITSRAFARGGSYQRMATRVPPGRVLDLACGDGPILDFLGRRAIGLDLSLDELRLAKGSVVQGRAQALPFAERSFDAVTCHLAFMLFDDIDAVVAELARVLRPGAPFIALVGGGPSAHGRDAFHAFASHLPGGRRFGDPRASSEQGWSELFRTWTHEPRFERWPLDLGGSFDDVWTFLSSSYQLPAGEAERIRGEVRAEFPGPRVPCTVVTYLATVRL